jgi:hypothetical protein
LIVRFASLIVNHNNRDGAHRLKNFDLGKHWNFSSLDKDDAPGVSRVFEDTVGVRRISGSAFALNLI